MTEPATLVELAQAIATGTLSAERVTAQCLARIDNGVSLNAFISVFRDAALERARQADLAVAAGERVGPLHGVPVSLKDIIDVAGTPTTAGSRVRDGHTAARHAPVVERLLDAGAVLIGKTNLHEFALGPTNDDSAFGPVRHPQNAQLSSGGSSGGSAVSVATGMAWASVGTDTGGSIRIPAAICGVVGLKPAVGDVSTDGVVPLSLTLDHVGPLCRTVADAQRVYEVLAGVATPRQDTRQRPLRLGVPRAYFLDGLEEAVTAAFDEACRQLESADVVLTPVDIAHAADTGAIYVCIALAEAAEYHASTIEARPHDYTPAIRPRLQAGRYILAEDYLRARRGRRVLTAAVDAALDGVDALLLPTVPVTAQPIGAASVRIGGRDEPVRNTLLKLTQTFNVTGHPALTMPLTPAPAGLPIGVQLVGPRGATHALLRTAAAVERILRASGVNAL